MGGDEPDWEGFGDDNVSEKTPPSLQRKENPKKKDKKDKKKNKKIPPAVESGNKPTNAFAGLEDEALEDDTDGTMFSSRCRLVP